MITAKQLLKIGQEHARGANSVLEPRFTSYNTNSGDRKAIVIYERQGRTLGDIVICPGYPGRENMVVLGKSLAQHGYRVHLPAQPGTKYAFEGEGTESNGDSSFITALENIEQYFLRIPRNGKPVILGGFSSGSVLAARIAEHNPQSVDGIFMIGGVFGTLEYFNGPSLGRKDISGWEGARRYFHACIAKQSEPGNVQIQGDPEKIYSSFRELVEGGLGVEEVLRGLSIPTAIVHSLDDEIVPFSHVEKFFPSSAMVLTFNMGHEMCPLDETGTPQRDIADSLYAFFTN